MGLPSGTLWAKENCDEKLAFYPARHCYGSYLPTKNQVQELKKHCRREPDPASKSLVLVGPNGNSIRFMINDALWTRDLAEGNYLAWGYDVGIYNNIYINERETASLKKMRLCKRK